MSEEEQVDNIEEVEEEEVEEGEEEDDEKLSDTDILRVVKHFLLSSPPGEFEDVLADVRDLVRNDELLNTGARDIFHNYNVEQLIPVDVTDDEGKNLYKTILCKYGEIDEKTYLDPRSNKLLTVDHTKGTVSKIVDNEEAEDDTIKTKREALQKACDEYLESHYLNGISTVFPSKESGDELVCCFTASKFNEKNFWSGRWRSVFRVKFNEDGKSANVSGSMKVNVHYYERGNVQLNSSKDYAEAVKVTKEDQLYSSILKVIQKVENSYQQDIDGACGELNEMFKSLRRKLPLTKDLFNFASNQHSLVGDMSG